MTIKQLGGVFGRNPTFNDVTIEGQLTFDGDIDINSDLKVDGDLDVTGGMTIDTDTLVVTSANNRVGVGTDAPVADLDVRNNISMGDGTSVTNLSMTRNSANYITASNADGYLAFRTGGSNERLRLDGSGNAKITNGNLIMGTSGKGIDFSATSGTGTSELLDDYEEGVHTTSATCTTSGTIGFVGSNNQLAYTKIGNVVHVSGYLYVNAVSSPVGGVQISLPFTAADLADSGGSSVASLYLTNVVAKNVADFVGKIDEGNDFLLIYLGDSNTVQANSAQQIKAGSQIYISITYKTA